MYQPSLQVTLSENVSETLGEVMIEENPGGRPPAFSDELMDLVREMYPHVQTRRGRLNVAYRIHALDVASDEDVDGLRRGDWPLPPTVLTELGRLLKAGWSEDSVRYLWTLVERADPKARNASEALKKLRRSEADRDTAFAFFVNELEDAARANLGDEWWTTEPGGPNE